MRARAAIREAGYRCLSHHVLRDLDGKVKQGEVWFYGNGQEVLILHGMWSGREWDGWNVYAPITDSPMVVDTIAAIFARNRVSAAGGV